MLHLEILHTDITQMDVDRIVCPIHKDGTPYGETGETTFSAAGYAQLQESILADDRLLRVTGFSVPPFQLKAKSLFLLKVLGSSEKDLQQWYHGAFIMSIRSKDDHNGAVPILIDTEDVVEAENHWRSLLRWLIRNQKTQNDVEKTLYLVTRSEWICEIGQRL